MNGLIAAPLQFCADRRFAGAGNALDKIISFAHKIIHYFARGITASSAAGWQGPYPRRNSMHRAGCHSAKLVFSKPIWFRSRPQEA
jgi:hypothetical protein